MVVSPLSLEEPRRSLQSEIEPPGAPLQASARRALSTSKSGKCLFTLKSRQAQRGPFYSWSKRGGTERLRGNQTDRSQRTESSNISVHLETTHHHSYPRALSMPVTPTAICASHTRRGHPRRPTRVARNRTTVLSGHSRGQHLSQQNFLPPAAMGARGPVAPPRAAG